MKVLICHERYEPDFGGGGEVVVHQTALQLAKLGVEVQVITAGDPQIRSIEGVPTHRLPVGRYRFNLAGGVVTELARSADIIQAFNYHACLPALTAGRRTGTPVVCGVLGLFEQAWRSMRGPLAGRLFQAWEHFLLRRPYARVFFLSEFSRQAGIRLGVDPARAFVAAPGVDSDLFRPAEEKDDVVLFAAKLDPRKGVDELVAVARALPQVRFQVAGWGAHPCAAPLATLANVELLEVSREDGLREAFARARIFFFPSRAETYGMVLVEAMAAGCAIVSTVDLGYAGIPVPSGDVGAMIQALRELWDDPARTTAMGSANVARAQQITWSRFAETLLSVYDELHSAGANRSTGSHVVGAGRRRKKSA